MLSTLQPLPPAWVDRLFLRMAGKYGDTWTRKWEGVQDQAKAEWGEGLAGFTAEEIRTGLSSLGVYPPSLPEFVRLCRPSIDPERAFYEALRQMRIRNQGGTDRWSSPLVFWAAVWLGDDLFSQPYKFLAKRWEEALADTARDMERGDVPNRIPPRPLELPAPSQRTGNWLLREICVQTFVACMEGRACPCVDPVNDLPWLKNAQRPRLKPDCTYLMTVSQAGGLLTEIVENAARAAAVLEEAA